jgi:hypothetical protein
MVVLLWLWNYHVVDLSRLVMLLKNVLRLGWKKPLMNGGTFVVMKLPCCRSIQEWRVCKRSCQYAFFVCSLGYEEGWSHVLANHVQFFFFFPLLSILSFCFLCIYCFNKKHLCLICTSCQVFSNFFGVLWQHPSSN